MKGFEIYLPLLGALLSSSVFATENPAYAESSEILTVPAVDSEEGPGLYQDVTLEVTESGDWRLISGHIGRQVREISSIELIESDTSPVQIFLEFSGTFSNGCPNVGHISHRLVGNTFEIAVYYRHIPNPELILCTQALVDFSKTIALPVYGLEAGEYHYIVNGDALTDNNTGEFTLENDNSL